jgi:kynurenine formamidase
MSAKPSNWGRWGQVDQQGTLNLITPQEIKFAAKLVKAGKIYSLSVPLDADGPQFPMRHKTWKTTSLLNVGDGIGFSDDVVIMHSHSGTHMDSLCHVWSDHQLYNGFDVREHVTSFGSTRNGIEHVPAIVGRGILLDIAGWKGVRHLSLGETISASDLDRCAASQNTTIAAGDIVLVNTGWMNIFAQNRALFDSGEPRLDMSCIEWLHQHDISAVGADNQGVEVITTMPPAGLPFHFAAIRDLGLYLLENLKLQPLADDKQYEFLFVTTPLPLTSAVGSPINPLAIV